MIPRNGPPNPILIKLAKTYPADDELPLASWANNKKNTIAVPSFSKA